jgi:hypothetical protein
MMMRTPAQRANRKAELESASNAIEEGKQRAVGESFVVAATRSGVGVRPIIRSQSGREQRWREGS